MAAVSDRPSDTPLKPGARTRILESAAALAREVGPANLALDAVAARAGVSKGGLLYHFPSKLDLLKALVDDHLAAFECRLAEGSGHAEAVGPGNAMQSYLVAFLEEQVAKTPAPAGVVAAMVQNPELLAPVRAFKRRMLDRLTAEASDPDAAMLFFLALEGLRSLWLFDMEILTEAEKRRVETALAAMVPAQGPPPGR